jgi:hypothetical protein
MQPQEKEIVTDEIINLVLAGVDLVLAQKQLNQVIPDLLELKESLTGVARDPYMPAFDLRAEKEKDWEMRRQVGRFVNQSCSNMSPAEEARIPHYGKFYFAAVAKLAALLAERIPGEKKKEKIKDHYSFEEWLSLLVRAVDLEKALDEARNLFPDALELQKKLAAIVAPEQDEVNLRVSHLLAKHISRSHYILVWRSGAAINEEAVPDQPRGLIEEQACRRLASLLVGRIQTSGAAADFLDDAQAKAAKIEKGQKTQEGAEMRGQVQGHVDDSQLFQEGLQKKSFPPDEDAKCWKRLSPRQVNLFRHITEHCSVTIQDLEKLYPNVNRRTLQRDLKALIEEGLIKSEGATHRLIYRGKHEVNQICDNINYKIN